MLFIAIICGSIFGAQQDSLWRRGNTHTHTLWSDGDAAPEYVINWYVKNGYDFLVLSDHNIIQMHEDWFPVSPGTRLTVEDVGVLKDMFGADWPQMRDHDGQQQMRLRTLPELKALFDKENRFVLIPGEEVTDRFQKHEVHINAMNIDEVVAPQRGGSVQGTIQRNLDAISEQGRKSGREVLAHINHPNFGWSLTAEDLASIHGERFFEVYNGHRSVHNQGDATRPSTEELWDQALVMRLHKGAGDGGILYGLATDDSHNHDVVDGVSIPGRGWVMVRSKELNEDAIVKAMKAGEFYASTGVFIRDIRQSGNVIEIEIETKPGVEYLTEFIATRRIDDGVGPIGEVVATSRSAKPRYEMSGDELYVRARITSTQLHPRPYQVGDFEIAWAQPVRPASENTILSSPSSRDSKGESDDRRNQ